MGVIGLLVGLLVAWYADAALLLGWQFSRKWDAEVEHWRAVTQRAALRCRPLAGMGAASREAAASAAVVSAAAAAEGGGEEEAAELPSSSGGAQRALSVSASMRLAAGVAASGRYLCTSMPCAEDWATAIENERAVDVLLSASASASSLKKRRSLRLHGGGGGGDVVGGGSGSL